MNSFPEGFRALVIGASGGLGQAFAQLLQADLRCAEVRGVHRHSKPRIDFDDEASVADAAPALVLHHFSPLLDGKRGVLDGLTAADTGSFVTYNGERLPW